MNRRILKILAIILSLGLACFAVVLMFNYKNKADTERQSIAEYADPINDKLVRLMAKRDALELEIEDIEEELAETDDRLGSVVILFTEPRKAVSGEIATIMEGYDYQGTIVLTVDYYPGAEDCMSWQEIKDLQKLGWDICAGIDQVSELDEMKEIFEKGKMTFPKTVYYPDAHCGDADKELLADYGIENVIEYEGVTTRVTDGDIWQSSAYGSNMTDSSSRTKEYLGQSKPITLTVGFENNREIYSQSNFEAMLKVLADYESKGEAEIVTIGGARSRYGEHCKNTGAVTQAIEDEYLEKKAELAEIEKELNELRK